MHNFLRALRKASKHWPSLLIAAACSFAVAALWGANIGAFYPILEVTIRGKSMQTWLAEEIQTRETTIVSLDASMAELEAQLAELPTQADGSPAPEVAAEAARLQTSLGGLRSERASQQAQIAGYEKMRPWIDRFVPASPFQTIAWIVAALMASTLIRHFFLISNEYLVGRVALDVSRDLRMGIFEKAMYMDRAGYAQYGTAGFMAQMTHTTDMLSTGLINAFGAAIREPLKVVACLVGAGLICWRLLLLSLIIAPVVGWLLVSVTRRIKATSSRMLCKAGSFHAVMHESLGNIQTVQAYRMEPHEQERFGDATLMMRNFGLKFIFYTSLSKPIIEFLGLGMLGTTIVGGAYLVLNKETHIMGIPICEQPLSVSALLVFFGMLIGISDPLRKLSAVYSTIYSGTVAADAVFSMLDRPHSIQDPANPVDVASPHRVLSLNHIDFAYQPNQQILNDVSLDVPYGSTIAIVGHNGCGKSTLINLLCRFYDPSGGALALDGVDFREMRVDDLRKRIALVNQHTELFNETVTYNIRYGNPGATDEDVVRVAREAHAHEFIVTALEAGYDTVVGQNGHKLSGGQRQRIALARALLCEPEILILDEASSQIDMQSEQLIRESLARHRGERTMIIITHREKLLELADRIFEVKDGRLVETNAASRSAA